MDTIFYITVAHTLFVILLLATKKPNQISDKILCVLIATIASPIVGELMAKNHLEYDHLFNKICFCAPLLFGPFLYFYTRILISEEPFALRSQWPHFLPFIIFLLIYILIPHYYNPPFRTVHLPLTLFNRMFDLNTKMLSWIAYSVLSLYLIEKHKRNILNIFSYKSKLITLQWLKYLNICFVVSLLCSILLRFILYPRPGVPTFVHIPRNILLDMFSFILLIYLFSFFGLKQPLIFKAANKKETQETSETIDKNEIAVEFDKSEKKYLRSGLSDELAQEYQTRLIDFMENKEPYLEGDLTIEKLAKELGILRHYLTQVINQNLGKNFYTFINEYRVEKAKNIMLNKESTDKKLIDIAYDSGFNSYSAFNVIFKKITKTTPSQFRKSKLHS